MGDGCQYVIVQSGQYDLWYSDWGANIAHELFWGPEQALELVRDQNKEDDRLNWFDEISCGGAALIDLDQKVLLFFGGDIKYDIPRRKAFLELLQVQWPGWIVRWAHEGISEVAEQAGYSRPKRLLSRYWDTDTDGPKVSVLPPGPPGRLHWDMSVATVRWRNGRLGIYLMNNHCKQVLHKGARLTRILKRTDWGRFWRRQRFDSAKIDLSLYSGGVHIDEGAQQISFWLTAPYGDALERVSDKWPEWRVTWHGSAYERQEEVTEGRLVFTSEAQDVLKREALADLEYAGLLGAEGLGAAGHEVDRNSEAELRERVLARLKMSLEKSAG